MTPAELEQIVSALKPNNEPQPRSAPDQKALIDNIMRIITSLTLGGILWLSTSVMSMREAIIKSEVKLEQIEEFTSAPRFTPDDFTNKTASILQSIQKLTDEQSLIKAQLNTRTDYFSQINLDLQKLAIDIASLQKDLEILKGK